MNGAAMFRHYLVRVTESGRRQPHSKTVRGFRRIGVRASILECGCFLPLRVAIACVLATAPALAAPYNVLFIAVDDLRPELHCYGATHIVSPSVDRLANAGRVFRRHFVSVPTCGASRYSLMTGRRPTTLADTENTAFNQLPTSEGSNPESFAHLFRRNGWHTACLGKISDEPDGFEWSSSAALGGSDRGRTKVAKAEMPFSWDEIIFGHDKWGARCNPIFNYGNGSGRTSGVSPAYEIGTNLLDEGYLDGQIAKAAVAKLEEFKQEGTRFLLAVGFLRPHLPFNAPKAYFDLYNPNALPAPFPLAAPANALAGTAGQSSELDNYNHGYYPGDPGTHNDEAYRRRLRWAYFASVSYVDAQVGKVLDALDSLGLATNTIVVLWGDNGWCLDDYNLLGKHIVLERGVHCPLIIRTPRMTFPGGSTDGIVESIDIYPTLARLCGLTPPATVNGTSLVPMLNNPDAPGKGWAYSRDMGSLTQNSVRTDRWRLIRVNSAYDLYDFHASPYEVEDISATYPDVVNGLVATNLNVQSTRAGTTNFNSWKGAFFTPAERTNPAISGPQADPDMDGVSNIFECLGATHPRDPGSAGRLIGQVRDLSTYGWPDEYFTARWTVSALVDDISFHVEGSSSPGQWTTSALGFVTNASLGGGLYEYLYRSTNNLASEPLGFVRVCAEQTP
jgi:arylsulfatase A-like enzyme